MQLKDLRTLIQEVKGERKVVVYEAKFSHIRQIMMGVIPRINTVGILTAQNPDGKPADREFNEKNMKALERDLRGMNYGYHKIQGKFGLTRFFWCQICHVRRLCPRYQVWTGSSYLGREDDG